MVILALVMFVAVPTAIGGQRTAAANPCVSADARTVESTLRPVDEAARRPDFVEFRRRLEADVARRNTAAILAVVHPNVRTSFGDSGGIQAFQKEHLGGKTETFWDEFATILRLGGRFRADDAFDAPYTYSAWPADLDSFECLAVAGSRVRVRAAPALTARILTALDFAVVRALPGDGPGTPAWTRVQLASGTIGYIASRYVRRPIDHRALFEFHDGRWWLMAYVDGD
jgi:hypothetical protein